MGYHLPFGKITQLFANLNGYQVNSATNCNANGLMGNRVEQSEQLIQQELIKQEVVYADETGIQVAGKNHWLYTTCKELFTYVFVHPNQVKEETC